jgi:hypothetical protein
MGNSVKYNHVGGLHIQLPSSVFQSTDFITGTIHVTLSQPLPACYLEFQFKGKEVTHWTEQRSNGKQSYTVSYNGKHHNAKIKCIILNWTTGLAPGGYSIPFSFKIPNNLPGSFHFSRGSTQAHIQYKIHAKVLSGHENLKGKELVHIVQVPAVMNTNINLTKNARLTTWCCVKKGSMKMSVHWPQDVYEAHQVAECFLEIDNSESKLGVVRADVKLFYMLRMRSNCGRIHMVKETVLQSDYQVMVAPGEQMTGERATKLHLNLADARQMLANVHSASGTLIQCEFFIEVRARNDGNCTCCGDQTLISSFFRIKPTFVVTPTVVQPPAGWHPVMYAPAALQYDPALLMSENRVPALAIPQPYVVPPYSAPTYYENSGYSYPAPPGGGVQPEKHEIAEEKREAWDHNHSDKNIPPQQA